MDEMNESEGFLDPTKYSDKSRKIIFGIVVVVMLIFVGLIMFLFSPSVTPQTVATNSSSTNATQAPVNNESSANATTAPDAVPTYTAGAYPTSEADAAAQAQQKIIARSKAEASTLPKDAIDDDTLETNIQNSLELQTIASKGMMEYCTDNPKETKEQKQSRMKPYFHSDSSDYKSPQTIFFVKKCSLGGVNNPVMESGNVVVTVGIAWAGQLDDQGKASTGYTQYTVIVDKDGIVSFHD